jgi:hypothetical protein
MSEQTITCDRCSATIPAGSETCPQCGAPLSENAAAGLKTVQLESPFQTMKIDQSEIEKPPAAPKKAESPPDVPEEYLKTRVVDAPPPARPVEVSRPPETSFTESEPEKPAKSRAPLIWIGGACAVIILCCLCLAVVGGAIYFLAPAAGY